MTAFGKGRFLFYVLALAAGAAALAGYAEFDAQGCLLEGNCMFDMKPFDLKEFALTVVTTGGNALAALMVWRQRGK